MSAERIALVTGANQGVGLEVATKLAAHGVSVYLGSRDLARGEAADIDTFLPTSAAQTYLQARYTVPPGDDFDASLAVDDAGDGRVVRPSATPAVRARCRGSAGPAPARRRDGPAAGRRGRS